MRLAHDKLKVGVTMHKALVVKVSVLMACIAAVGVSWGLAIGLRGGGTPPVEQFGRGEVTHLSICVDGTTPPTAAEMDLVRQGATGLRKWHDGAEEAIVRANAENAAAGEPAPSYTPVPFVEPVVAAGCPGGAAVPPTDRDPGARVRPDPIDVASPFQVHFYLLSDDEADATAGITDSTFRQATYEVGCFSGRVCAAATTAMFVRRSAMRDAEAVSELLARATGLFFAVGGDYPDGHPPSENGKTK